MDFLLIIILLIIFALVYFYFKKGDPDLDFILPIIENQPGKINDKIDKYLNSLYTNEPSKEYLNSKFVRNIHHVNIYYNEENKHEYKIYPLCCKTCEINALKEIEYLKELKGENIPEYYNNPFTTKLFPNKNVNSAGQYLVLEREHLKLIDNDIKNINYTSFEKLLKTISFVHEKYNKYLSDLTINNIGVDSSGNLKIIDLNCIKPITGKINIYAPKYGILTKLNPDLFGSNKDKYIKMIETITQKINKK